MKKFITIICVFALGTAFGIFLPEDKIVIKKVEPFPIAKEKNIVVPEKEKITKKEVKTDTETEQKYQSCLHRKIKSEEQIKIEKQKSADAVQYKITSEKCYEYQVEIVSAHNKCEQNIKELQNSINICYAQCGK